MTYVDPHMYPKDSCTSALASSKWTNHDSGLHCSGIRVNVSERVEHVCQLASWQLLGLVIPAIDSPAA